VLLEQPYSYLNLDIKISEEWKSIIDLSNPARQAYRDIGNSLVDDESKRILQDAGIVLDFGRLWSWPATDDQPPLFHIDLLDNDINSPKNPLCAINTLIQGTPSFQEWTTKEKCTIVDVGNAPVHKEAHNSTPSNYMAYHSNLPVNYAAELKKGYSILCRVDIPHRVRTDLIKETRWSYSLRFLNKQGLRPSYNEVKELLKDYIIS